MNLIVISSICQKFVKTSLELYGYDMFCNLFSFISLQVIMAKTASDETHGYKGATILTY